MEWELWGLKNRWQKTFAQWQPLRLTTTGNEFAFIGGSKRERERDEAKERKKECIKSRRNRFFKWHLSWHKMYEGHYCVIVDCNTESFWNENHSQKCYSSHTFLAFLFSSVSLAMIRERERERGSERGERERERKGREEKVKIRGHKITSGLWLTTAN